MTFHFSNGKKEKKEKDKERERDKKEGLNKIYENFIRKQKNKKMMNSDISE